MNDKHIEIKEQSRGFFLKGFFFLGMMIVSLVFAFQPLFGATTHTSSYYILGGAVFAIFTAFFAFHLYKECKPSNALILNARSFIDIKNVGDKIPIQWTNVESVKVMGRKESPFLGITLENSDIVTSMMKEKNARVMRENLEEGLPAIIIAQSDVRIPIDELKSTFSKFVRDARTLDKETPKKQKNNPFSTEDVLRAFGKDPKEIKDIGDTKIAESSDNVVKKVSTDTEDPFMAAMTAKDTDDSACVDSADIPVEENDSEIKEAVEIITESSSDDDIDILGDDVPEEIKDVLSRAKSSKITEIEKMLSEDSTYVVEDSVPETKAVIEDFAPVEVDSYSEKPVIVADTEETAEQDNVIDEEYTYDEKPVVVTEPEEFEAIDESSDEKEYTYDEKPVVMTEPEETTAPDYEDEAISESIDFRPPEILFPQEMYEDDDDNNINPEFVKGLKDLKASLSETKQFDIDIDTPEEEAESKPAFDDSDDDLNDINLKTSLPDDDSFHDIVLFKDFELNTDIKIPDMGENEEIGFITSID